LSNTDNNYTTIHTIIYHHCKVLSSPRQPVKIPLSSAIAF
jgi:hypothetical protein